MSRTKIFPRIPNVDRSELIYAIEYDENRFAANRLPLLFVRENVLRLPYRAGSESCANTKCEISGNYFSTGRIIDVSRMYLMIMASLRKYLAIACTYGK